MTDMNKIIAIVGPTASGKTALSISIAKRYGGEIISCDSMQIYKRMNIGTAKPTVCEMCGIRHHLIDIVEPDEAFSCADYTELAKKKICDIQALNKIPIFCGGTGLYVDHTLLNTEFSAIGSDEKFRNKMNLFALEKGREELHGKLEEVDPESASKIHYNDVKRVIRALEIFELTGKPKSEWDKESHYNSEYDPLYILLDFKDRDKLYSRINQRVDKMVEEGLEKEVRDLYSEGLLKENTTSGQAIGYKEFIEYFKGKISKEEAISLICKNTRNYAKRQLTWFHANKQSKTLYVDDYFSFEDLEKSAFSLIDGQNLTEEKT